MSIRRFALLAFSLFSASALAQTDAEGCKDHPLFPRMANFHIGDCASSQSEVKRFPVGAPHKTEKETAFEEVKGPYLRIHYALNDGAVRPDSLQTMRDFESAAKQAGASVMGEYSGTCKAVFDDAGPGSDNCIKNGVTVKASADGRETWAFMQSTKEAAGYELRIVERDEPRQTPVANEMLEKIIKDGYVTLHINFDLGKASIRQESIPVIVQIVEMLKLAPELGIEVDGHTDNVGGEKVNQELSEARAQSVVKTLSDSGVPAARLTAMGYGQSKPVADNKTAEGRAKNRRVELRKR